MLYKVRKIFVNGFVFGCVFFALGVIIGVAFHLPLKNALSISAPVGVVALLANGLTYGRFRKPLKKLQSITATLQDAEFLKHESPANYYIDDHAIPGKLFLTNRRLLFKSYQQDEHTWPLFNPQLCRFHPTLFNAGGEFIFQDGSNERLVFEVDELRRWKKLLSVAWEKRYTKLAID